MSTHSMYRRASRPPAERASDDTAAPSLPYVGLILFSLCVFRLIVAAVMEEDAGAEVGIATVVGMLSAHAFISVWWERRGARAREG